MRYARRVHVTKHFKRSKKGKKFKVDGHSRKVLSKSELIHKVVDRTKLPRKDVSNVFDTSLEVMKTDLRSGHNIRLGGFGIFKIKHVKARPSRKGVNPFTKKVQTFKAKPAKSVIRFRPSKEIRL